MGKSQDPKPSKPTESPTVPPKERKRAERKKGGFAVVVERTPPGVGLELRCLVQGLPNAQAAERELRDIISDKATKVVLKEDESFGIIQIKATGLKPTVTTITKVTL